MASVPRQNLTGPRLGSRFLGVVGLMAQALHGVEVIALVTEEQAVIPTQGDRDDGAVMVEPLAPKIRVRSALVYLGQDGAGFVDQGPVGEMAQVDHVLIEAQFPCGLAGGSLLLLSAAMTILTSPSMSAGEGLFASSHRFTHSSAVKLMEIAETSETIGKIAWDRHEITKKGSSSGWEIDPKFSLDQFPSRTMLHNLHHGDVRPRDQSTSPPFSATGQG